MFVLAGAGDGRRYTQIFNRYDRCCYRNLYGTLYETQVQDAIMQTGSNGQFRVLIDESHADHQLSEWAAERILDSLSPKEPAS